MGNNSTYTHPPVTEAVFEVKFGKSLPKEIVEKIAQKLKTNFPHKQPINDIQLSFEQKSNVVDNININTTNQGYWLASEDQLDKVMISNVSFAFARLAPYNGWEALYEKFVEQWKRCKRDIGTISISRLGLRFINRIDIPFNQEIKIDLDEYLNFAPKTPQISEHPITDYVIRVTQMVNDKWRVNISSHAIPSPLINNISLLLDIDLYTVVGSPLGDEVLFELLSSGRELKNNIFEKCITPKSRELFSK